MVTLRRQIGNLGEKIALDYLKKQGYQILDKNYQKPWGEIDLIAQHPKSHLVFVEIKTRKTQRSLGTKKYKGLFPEENVSLAKQQKVIRTIRTYLLEKNYPPETSWQIDVIAIELNLRQRKARLTHFKNAFWQ